MFRKEVVLKISVWVHAAHESGVKPGLWSKIAAWAHLGWAARAPSHQHRTIIQSYNHQHAPHYPQVAQRAARATNVLIYFCFSLISCPDYKCRNKVLVFFEIFFLVNKNEWPISRPIYVNTKLKCFNNPAPCLWIQRQASDRIKCMARGLFRTIYQNVMHCAEDTQQPAARPRLNARKIGE